LDRGYFVAPTVFADVRDEMRIAREEIFGPMLSALSFDTLEEVVKRANETQYGLGAGVWSRNVSTVHTVAKSLRTGSVWANCYQVMDPAIPFGGYKSSGFGRGSGVEHLHEYLQTKAVTLRLD
jgi:aldehyde dehydrogenase (NAD+)